MTTATKRVTTSKNKPSYWLMKSEPDEFSIDDLARKGRGSWDGVRNYQARNHMCAMREGDIVLFYHSSTDPIGVVGLARVAREAYPDHTQFDGKSEYYDPKSKADSPRWMMVDVEFLEKLPRIVTLDEIKADPELSTMLVARKGMRLSVQPVDAAHARRLVKAAKGKTALPG
jgi:predicted RNA-binding protein with PUA-like domain